MVLLSCLYSLPISCQRTSKVRTLQLVEVSYYFMLGFNLIHRILILSQGGICSTFYGVYSELAKKDSSNLPSYVSTSRLERNFNDDPGAMDWSTTALSSTHSFSQNRSGFGEILVKSTNFAPSLEASHEVCLNGENFLNQPVCGRGLDDHLDSDTETSSTISNGGMGPSSMSMQRKHQVNLYSSFCVALAF